MQSDENSVLRMNSRAFLACKHIDARSVRHRVLRSIEDLAGCATDDLYEWIEHKSGNVARHDGILERFAVSRSECDTMILHARIKAGWI